MKLKFWERRVETELGVTYKAKQPHGVKRNGFADVIGSDGTEICTCYCHGLKNARLIASALNAYTGKRT